MAQARPVGAGTDDQDVEGLWFRGEGGREIRQCANDNAAAGWAGDGVLDRAGSYASGSTSLWEIAKSASSRRVEDASLIEDVREMALHGLFRDGVLLRDVLVAAAFDDAGDHFELARGEAVGLALGDGGGLLHQLVQGGKEVGDAFSADPVVAREDSTKGLREVPGDGVP